MTTSSQNNSNNTHIKVIKNKFTKRCKTDYNLQGRKKFHQKKVSCLSIDKNYLHVKKMKR